MSYIITFTADTTQRYIKTLDFPFPGKPRCWVEYTSDAAEAKQYETSEDAQTDIDRAGSAIPEDCATEEYPTT